MKDYFLKILETCAPEDGELQDAIEHALIEHRVNLSGVFVTDVANINAKKDEVLGAFRQFKSKEMMEIAIDCNFGVPVTEISSGT